MEVISIYQFKYINGQFPSNFSFLSVFSFSFRVLFSASCYKPRGIKSPQLSLPGRGSLISEGSFFIHISSSHQFSSTFPISASLSSRYRIIYLLCKMALLNLYLWLKIHRCPPWVKRGLTKGLAGGFWGRVQLTWLQQCVVAVPPSQLSWTNEVHCGRTCLFYWPWGTWVSSLHVQGHPRAPELGSLGKGRTNSAVAHIHNSQWFHYLRKYSLCGASYTLFLVVF